MRSHTAAELHTFLSALLWWIVWGKQGSISYLWVPVWFWCLRKCSAAIYAAKKSTGSINSLYIFFFIMFEHHVSKVYRQQYAPVSSFKLPVVVVHTFSSLQVFWASSWLSMWLICSFCLSISSWYLFFVTSAAPRSATPRRTWLSNSYSLVYITHIKTKSLRFVTF